MVLGSDTRAVYLIQCHYMSDFPANILPDFMNKDKNYISIY